MKISVVVPTYRRPDLLERCLNALMEQKIDDDYEIIVADNAGQPATYRRVRDLARQIEVPLVYSWAASKRGPAHARNIGWQAARSELIAFTDDDTIPDKNWLAAAVNAFDADQMLSAAAGKTTVPIPEKPTDYELNESGLASAEFVTANCFCRRSVLEEIGGFDEEFTAAWREDSDLQFRLLELGKKVGRVENAIVIHPVRPAGFGISIRQQQKAMLDALLFKKHPTLFKRSVDFVAGRYYLIVTALVAAALSAFLGSPLLATVLFLIWLGLSVRFSIQRLQKTSRSPVHIFEMIVTSILIPPTAIFWRLFGAVKYRVWFY